MKNSILVISDIEEQNYTAIKQAAELAKAYQCNLHIINFCYENLRGVADTEAAKAKIIHSLHEVNAHKLVNTLVNKSPDGQGEGEAKIDYNFETIWAKNIHLWISNYVAEHKPFMVVKTGHKSEALLYTPTDWHLIRKCQAPVLIAADKKWHKARNVLATVDLETELSVKKQLNEKVLRHASILAKHINAELHICYTVPYSPLLKKLGLTDMHTLEKMHQDALKDKLQLLAKNYGIVAAHIHIKSGEVAKVITSVAAECKASLVVVGTVGRKGLNQKLVGNTAEAILHLLKTDVLVIKP